jgi:hypothetical protein
VSHPKFVVWTFLCLSLLLPEAARGAASGGRVVGRLVFRQGDQVFTPRQVRRHLEGGRLDFDLSRAGEFAQVRLENDGYFVATGGAGTYRLEYVYAGRRVEFVVPHTLEIPAEGVACAGTFTLAVENVAEDVGANRPSTRLEVSDGCTEMRAHLEQLAPSRGPSAVQLARPASRLETPLTKPFSEYLVGLRVGYGLGQETRLLRASYVLAWHGNLREWGSALASVSVGRTSTGQYELAGGAGFTLLPSIELHAGGGVQPLAQTTSPFLYGHLRLDGAYVGLGVRCDLPLREGPATPVFQLTVDISPFYILGALL